MLMVELLDYVYWNCGLRCIRLSLSRSCRLVSVSILLKRFGSVTSDGLVSNQNLSRFCMVSLLLVVSLCFRIVMFWFVAVRWMVAHSLFMFVLMMIMLVMSCSVMVALLFDCFGCCRGVYYGIVDGGYEMVVEVVGEADCLYYCYLVVFVY